MTVTSALTSTHTRVGDPLPDLPIGRLPAAAPRNGAGRGALDLRRARFPLAVGRDDAASLSATGQGVNTGHARLLDGLLPTLVAPAGDQSLGSAHLAGLRSVVASGEHTDLAYSFGILGDPLVTLPFVPTHQQYVPLLRGGA